MMAQLRYAGASFHNSAFTLRRCGAFLSMNTVPSNQRLVTESTAIAFRFQSFSVTVDWTWAVVPFRSICRMTAAPRAGEEAALAEAGYRPAYPRQIAVVQD